MYERGEYPDTPDGVSYSRFIRNIRIWKRMVDSSGIASLRHKPQNKNWSPEEKLVLVSKVLAGDSYSCITLDNGINSGMLYSWVQKYKEKGYQLKYLLQTIGMARSTYYYLLNKVDAIAIRNEAVLKEIKIIFTENKGLYGVRKVHNELINRGFKVNHKRVQNLVNKEGLKGKRPKERYRSYKGTIGKTADNIINRDFSTTAPLQKWTTDVSQFNFSWGKCYFSSILDMNTNEIISYDLSLHPNLSQIKRVLYKAFEKFPETEGLIMHSDQGWQYQHTYYRNELKKHGIIQSMSRKENCYDNSIMETFFGRMKTEMYYGSEKNYLSLEMFSKAVDEYIYYYNNKRIQSKTKWMPPVQYRITSTYLN